MRISMLAAMALVGCSNGTTDDAGMDGTTQMDSSFVDASDGAMMNDAMLDAGPSTQYRTACGTSSCTMPEVCCVNGTDAGPTTQMCTSLMNCGGPMWTHARLECDEPLDCVAPDAGDAGPRSCCFTGNPMGLFASCASGACNNSVELCITNADCKSGTCSTYQCPTVGTVRACAKPMFFGPTPPCY